ncbi:DegV family protein [Clostridium sporogenes]|uniref:Fatty acid-binding protein DegV n=1 Tax=Clostridium sporogenes TaxID=1509 RepID=A0ABX4K6T6_CLOSG|nr:DegV family protein [Clostridium sporogenes]NFF64893.1 DegV family protein [Clostridium sporogenes]NFH47512.1 DegV family protein [Clostridium sporogenes]PHH00754.1 fatty acid-binding protein DegV [Clostridium sporogenes]UBI11793.1 DegV family protein [Clostridium sporogenes]UJA33398.1 DegV family protein [Clostridium sporogenes]
MKEYIIMTDSCCDLSSEYIEKNDIPYVPLTCSVEGKEYIDNFGQSLPYKEFYEAMIKGEIPKTSQPSPESYYKVFKDLIDKDKDILYVCVSSGLSGTYNSANIAKNMILDEFRNARIEIVDVLTASLGQGIMVIKAMDMKKNGLTIDEVTNYLEENKLNLNSYMVVNDLIHLKRGGRISTAAALIGTVLNIKPILTLNDEGRVITVRKAKGRKVAIRKLTEIVIERMKNPEEEIVAISHGDSDLDAEKLKERILKEIKVKDVIINYVGPVVGTYGGPGSLNVFFMSDHRQNHIIDIN